MDLTVMNHFRREHTEYPDEVPKLQAIAMFPLMYFLQEVLDSQSLRTFTTVRVPKNFGNKTKMNQKMNPKTKRIKPSEFFIHDTHLNLFFHCLGSVNHVASSNPSKKATPVALIDSTAANVNDPVEHSAVLRIKSIKKIKV